MGEILSSASKIVFILMALAVIGLTAFGLVDPKDFMVLASMAFASYFAQKGNPSPTDPSGGGVK